MEVSAGLRSVAGGFGEFQCGVRGYQRRSMGFQGSLLVIKMLQGVSGAIERSLRGDSVFFHVCFRRLQGKPGTNLKPLETILIPLKLI